MSVCCEYCVLSGRGLCDGLIASSRGVLPTVARHCVWSRNLENEEAKARYRAVTPRKQTNKYLFRTADIILRFLRILNVIFPLIKNYIFLCAAIINSLGNSGVSTRSTHLLIVCN
jgi:hypothetical protein